MMITLKSKKICPATCLLLLPFFSFGQEAKLKAINQFDFTQIDSLVNTSIENLSVDRSSFIVAYTSWFVGSYYEGDSDFVAHDNRFEIYLLFSKKGAFLVQKIDNYSFFQTAKIEGKDVGHFLAKSFGAMKKETLNPKVDTIYKNGQMLFSRTITDHQWVRSVQIVKERDTLQYEYPAEYSKNKRNLNTYRYKFLSYLGEIASQYNKKSAKRENVVLGYHSKERD